MSAETSGKPASLDLVAAQSEAIDIMTIASAAISNSVYNQ
jgi:hypothetical protein